MMCNKQISVCLEWLQSAERNSPAIVMLEIACQATTGPNLVGNHSTVYKCAFLPAFVLTVLKHWSVKNFSINIAW
jgi:hypothetical protein